MRQLRVLALSAVVGILTVGAVLPASAQASGPDARIPAWWIDRTAGVQVNGTYIPLVGNFDSSNPQDDIIWYSPGAGVEQLWTSTNDSGFAKQALSKQVNGTYEPFVGNFQGDSRDDILWYGRGTKPDVIWKTVGVREFESFSGGGFVQNGDYTPVILQDDDSPLAHDDILWWKPGTGPFPVWSMGNSATYILRSTTSPSSTAKPYPGDFNGDRIDDIFWYAPGTAADQLAFRTGTSTFGATVAQAVNGTYSPIVGQFSPGEVATKDDILWWKTGGGTIGLWSSAGNGTWAKENHSIPTAAKPIYALDGWGYLHLWTPGGTDHIWYDNAGAAPDEFSPTGNISPATGSKPLVGTYTGDDTDILWYLPGSGVEHLFHI